MSEVVNVWGGECLGGERLTICLLFGPSTLFLSSDLSPIIVWPCDLLVLLRLGFCHSG